MEALKLAVNLLTDLGGFAGLAAVIVALPKLKEIKKQTTTVQQELTPNHGSSLKDAVNRMEKNYSSIGHQIGELRRDATQTHALITSMLDDHSHRLQKLEQ